MAVRFTALHHTLTDPVYSEQLAGVQTFEAPSFHWILFP